MEGLYVREERMMRERISPDFGGFHPAEEGACGVLAFRAVFMHIPYFPHTVVALCTSQPACNADALVCERDGPSSPG